MLNTFPAHLMMERERDDGEGKGHKISDLWAQIRVCDIQSMKQNLPSYHDISSAINK
jgi:hypothetical protein